MSFQICLTCGNDFSGDDDDEDCDECAVERFEECEQNTGHKHTESDDEGNTWCKNCDLLLKGPDA